MKRLIRSSALVLLPALLCLPAWAQDSGIGLGHHGANVFAEFSAGRTGQGEGVVWGGSAGSYLQGRLLGLVVRGTALPSNSGIRLYDAVLGPRFAVSLPFVRLFAEAGGGMGHCGSYDATGNPASSWGPAWQVNLGFAHTLLPRVEWRILEGSYGRIYAGSNVSPVMLSTGVTLHVW
ncbi:MAG TPA: hypothetical protein VHU89_08500 [Acidobacteriaceae bacterium]|nr:hypothetical protein [Acidobacteriaceae bacterium]